MSPLDLLPPSVGPSTAKLALVLGGALVGAALARVVTRRALGAARAQDARAHDQRVRQLEAARREALTALAHATAALAERSLVDGSKAPRRAPITQAGHSPGGAPGLALWQHGFALYAAPERTLHLAADLDAPPHRAEEAPRGASGSASAQPSPPRSGAESWSIPLAPLPRAADAGERVVD